MLTVAWLALACAVVSMTLSKSTLFKPLRGALSRWHHLTKLANCVYCTSHWVAFWLVWVSGFRLLPGLSGFFITSFVLVALAAPVSWVIFRAISEVVE